MDVLIVDDNATIREFLTDIMKDLGVDRVLTAASLADALALVDSGERFDLLLTDMLMPPGGSGADLIAELRRRGFRQPMYVLSGCVGLPPVAGADGVLSKPVKYEVLQAIVLLLR